MSRRAPANQWVGKPGTHACRLAAYLLPAAVAAVAAVVAVAAVAAVAV